MDLNWQQLVEERNAWVAHNFPDDGSRTPLNSILGCMEEVGELVHHHLKLDQAIRGTEEEHIAGGKDAIGDLMVYLTGVMAHFSAFPQVSGNTLPGVTGDTAVMKLFDKVSGLSACWRYGASPHFASMQAYHSIQDITCGAMVYCRVRGWDFNEIVQSTWDHVKQRDWIKYPYDGMTA